MRLPVRSRGTTTSSNSSNVDTPLQDQLLLLDVTMNGLGRGVTLFLRDTEGRYFVPADTLAAWGVELLPGRFRRLVERR